jgi:hypothetical protein
MTTTEPTALVPVEVIPPNLVAPVADAIVLVENQKAYQNLCHALLDDSDYQQIDGGRFKKKSAWRKLNVAFNVDTTIVDVEETRDEQGRLIRAKVWAQAKAPNGRRSDGIGVCDVHDRHIKTGSKRCDSSCDGFRHFSHPEHDILATAHTRATNRASSDLYGMGEVSAEEVDASAATTAGFDPIAMLAQWMAEQWVRTGLAKWRVDVHYPAPSRFNAEQTAQALVQIGFILAAGEPDVAGSAVEVQAPSEPDPATPAHVHDDAPEASESVPGSERYDPDDPQRPFT